MATLTTSIGSFSDSLARTLCWSAVIDMAREGELAVPAFVRMVAAGMGQLSSVSLLQTAAVGLPGRAGTDSRPCLRCQAGKELLAAEGDAAAAGC